MTRYARQPDGRGGLWSLFGSGLARTGAAVARNPVAVGGTTAFLVSLAFVSANALYYQPRMHPNAFVSTRAPVAVPQPEVEAEPVRPQPAAKPRPEARQVAPPDETASVVPSPESTGSVPEPSVGDPTVRAVQTVLSDLGLYRGEIDGMTGPQTHAAIETYRRVVGLEAGADIDGTLLRQLGLQEGEDTVSVPEVAPKPMPRPARNAGDGEEEPEVEAEAQVEVETASLAGGEGEAVVRRVQAGLKAFGNENITIDGAMGARTREAIGEFQSLFGLPVTEEPDAQLLSKMREIGLIN